MPDIAENNNLQPTQVSNDTHNNEVAAALNLHSEPNNS